MMVGFLDCLISGFLDFGFLDFCILEFLDSWISVFLDSWIFSAYSIPFLKYVPSYLRSAFLPVSTPAMPSFLSLFGCTLESHHCWQSPFILQWIIARLHSQIEKGVEPHCWWTIMGFLLLVILKKKVQIVHFLQLKVFYVLVIILWDWTSASLRKLIQVPKCAMYLVHMIPIIL